MMLSSSSLFDSATYSGMLVCPSGIYRVRVNHAAALTHVNGALGCGEDPFSLSPSAPLADAVSLSCKLAKASLLGEAWV